MFVLTTMLTLDKMITLVHGHVIICTQEYIIKRVLWFSRSTSLSLLCTLGTGRASQTTKLPSNIEADTWIGLNQQEQKYWRILNN